MKVWLPSELNCCSMLLSITRIAVITTMMENTPTSTPSSVSAERSVCAAIALMAMEKLSRASARNEILLLFILQSGSTESRPTGFGFCFHSFCNQARQSLALRGKAIIGGARLRQELNFFSVTIGFDARFL